MTTPYPTNRWRGIVAVSLVVAAAGLLAKRQELLFLASVSIVFATYHRSAPMPTPALTLERRVDDHSPADGDDVEVTVAVTNEGDKTLFDCRVVDGVPPALSVTDGPARRGMVLRPGDTRTFSYTVEVQDGRHTFEPAMIVIRDPSGDREVECHVQAEDDTQLDCTTDITNAPLRPQTLETVGNVAAGMGSGIEFQQTRAYRRGDPVSQIDWNRYASTGDLTAIQFHEEQSASIVILVDARAVAHRGPPDGTHAVDAGVSAASQLATAFLQGQNHVGIAALASESCFLAPGAGREHRLKLQEVLTTHSAFATTQPGEKGAVDVQETTYAVDTQVNTYLGQLGKQTQVVFISPLCDHEAVKAARQFDGYGHAVTVVSPDVTADGTVGERLATVERRNRLRALRQVGIPVIEWSLDDPLALAIETERRPRI